MNICIDTMDSSIFPGDLIAHIYTSQCCAFEHRSFYSSHSVEGSQTETEGPPRPVMGNSILVGPDVPMLVLARIDDLPSSMLYLLVLLPDGRAAWFVDRPGHADDTGRGSFLSNYGQLLTRGRQW